MYVTHKRDDGAYQELRSHLQDVAERATAFAAPFGAPEHARRAGLLHDVGKYSPAGQKRQRDPEHTQPVDHSTAGAQEALKTYRDAHAAFAIAGHHGGLPDMGSKASLEDGTLMGRMQKALTGENDPSAWKTEVTVPGGAFAPAWLSKAGGFAQALYTRMLFSCLVDADYLDTEAYMSHGNMARGYDADFSRLLSRLREYVAPWLEKAESPVNAMRNELLLQCLAGAEKPRGLYTLTVPTGGGKTVSSLAFALSHAVRHGLSRVVYVAPYTSIIEQNAKQFRKILGNENVLEHHSNVNLNDEKGKLAAENWDAPVVVTTAVQFFESLFSCKTSRCRKLHNIANSVVILDEAQTLPIAYLRPCVNAIAELVQHYGVTAVLCTATQPALGELFGDYAPKLACMELAKEPQTLFRCFRRVTFAMEGCMEEADLAMRLSDARQALCIVNSRKQAQSLFHLLEGEGTYHLSTLMTPDHRSSVLDTIRQRLKEGLPCRVVSTSLVEAGVDLDFPTVWRQEAGLDSILQAAGRCNREGKREADQSIVHIFRFEQLPPKAFWAGIDAMRKTIEEHSDLSIPQAVEAYFRHLHFTLSKEAMDAKKILEKSNALEFQRINDAFQMIESQTIPVYIPHAQNRELLDLLREGKPTRAVLRALGRSAVNVYPQHFRALLEAGALECPMGDSFGILADPRQYDQHCGLALEPECGNGWFC